MHNNPFLYFSRKPILTGLAMFFLLMLLTQYLSYERYLLLRETELAELNNEANTAQDRLQTALSYSHSTAQTLAFIVEHYGLPDNFDSVGNALLQLNRFIDAVQLVQGGVITHVVPLAGNEAVIGFNILKDSARNSGALHAIETKKFFWAGPFELKQGGVGIVGRQPLYKANKFWGFSAVVIKLPTFLKAVGIDSTANNGFSYQLSKINSDKNFLPEQHLSKNTQTVSIQVPDVEWKLVVSKKNKAPLFFAITFSLLGLILSITGGLFAWFMARQPQQLGKLIEEKTTQLIASESNYQTTLERVSDAFVAIDKNFCYTYMNKKAGEIFHRDPLAILGKNMWVEFPDWVNKPFYHTFLQVMANQQYVLLEEYYPKQNLWFESHIYPSSNGLSIFINDITERKKAEQDVIAEKNLSDSIINSLPGAFYLYDETGKFIRWNKNFETVSGYSAEEVSRMHPLDFFDTSDKGILERKITDVFTKGMAEVEAPLLTKDKQKLDYYFNGHLANIDGKDYLIGMGIDITVRKKAELERNKAYIEKETALNRINDGVVSVDNEWRYTFINDAAIATNPAGRANVIGKNIWEVHPGMIGTILWDKYHEAMQTRKVVEVETYYEPLNFWAYVKVYPSADGLTFFYRDITEQKRAEQEIILEKNLSESVINSLPGIFYLADLNGKLLRWNKNFEIISGYSADEIQSMRVRDFVAMNSQQDVLMKKQLAIDKGVSDLEANFLTKQKQELPFHFTSVLSKYKNEPCLLGVGIDIAERKKAEAAILQSQVELRLLSAHLQTIREEERTAISRELHDELGQQLTALKMDIVWIGKKLNDSEIALKEKVAESSALIDETVKAIRRINTELRPSILDDLGLFAAIEWQAKEFSKRTGVNYSLKICDNEPVLDKNTNINIFRIFQETLTNITRHANATEVNAELKMENSNLIMTIKDNGVGFDVDEVKDKKSFGLLGIKERSIAMDGEIKIVSKKGKGTTIQLTLPCIS